MTLFSKSYNYLVASLVEYAPDSDGKGLDVAALLEEIDSNVSRSDKRHVRMLLARRDIENILTVHAGRHRYFSVAWMSEEEVALVAERYFKGGDVADDMLDLPPYIERVLASYSDPLRAADEEMDTSKSLEHTLWSEYYKNAEASSDPFIRKWSLFERRLRNIVAAFNARREGRDIAESLIGDDEQTQMLASSDSADFGLKGSFDKADELIAILESDNMLEKERKLDMLKWNMVDELTLFNYFDIDAVLGYLVKISIINRWMSLDRETGEKMLKQLIEQLTPSEVVKEAVARD